MTTRRGTVVLASALTRMPAERIMETSLLRLDPMTTAPAPATEPPAKGIRQVEPPAPESVAEADDNLSIAGEEDPGAALDIDSPMPLPASKPVP